MVAIAVVMAQFYAEIIVAAWQVVEVSSPGDVILILVVGLRQIRIGEIIDVATFDLVGEVMWHGALIDGRAE